MRLIWTLTAVLALLPQFVAAQMAAMLVADTVAIVGEDRLIATGNIEVLYDGNRLQASSIFTGS